MRIKQKNTKCTNCTTYSSKQHRILLKLASREVSAWNEVDVDVGAPCFFVPLTQKMFPYVTRGKENVSFIPLAHMERARAKRCRLQPPLLRHFVLKHQRVHRYGEKCILWQWTLDECEIGDLNIVVIEIVMLITILLNFNTAAWTGNRNMDIIETELTFTWRGRSLAAVIIFAFLFVY